jgi:hypothetical protein
MSQSANYQLVKTTFNRRDSKRLGYHDMALASCSIQCGGRRRNEQARKSFEERNNVIAGHQVVSGVIRAESELGNPFGLLLDGGEAFLSIATRCI